jgi:hypothetical protein
MKSSLTFLEQAEYSAIAPERTFFVRNIIWPVKMFFAVGGGNGKSSETLNP